MADTAASHPASAAASPTSKSDAPSSAAAAATTSERLSRALTPAEEKKFRELADQHTTNYSYLDLWQWLVFCSRLVQHCHEGEIGRLSRLLQSPEMTAEHQVANDHVELARHNFVSAKEAMGTEVAASDPRLSDLRRCYEIYHAMIKAAADADLLVVPLRGGTDGDASWQTRKNVVVAPKARTLMYRLAELYQCLQAMIKQAKQRHATLWTGTLVDLHFGPGPGDDDEEMKLLVISVKKAMEAVARDHVADITRQLNMLRSAQTTDRRWMEAVELMQQLEYVPADLRLAYEVHPYYHTPLRATGAPFTAADVKAKLLADMRPLETASPRGAASKLKGR
jgi:hypothetical protein